MRDFINIGPVPYEEPCAQVGAPEYQQQACQECTRFIDLLRRTVGEEPENAHLEIKSNPHDFGTYYEVVCYFDDDDEEAAKYAYRCESETPSQWDAPLPADQELIRVYDPCIEAAAEHGIPDYNLQAAIMVEIAADIEDHVCDTVEGQAVR